jgi:quercetin dioxygenase-like cupin family protein
MDDRSTAGGSTMTDLSADLSTVLQGAGGDGVHWTLETPGDLNVNLVHLDAGHAIGDHVNDEVDVVIVVLTGRGRLTIDGHGTDLAPHVVACVPKTALRDVRAADGDGLDYLSIHRRRGPLGIRPRPDEGGDPACWAHLFEETDNDSDPPGGTWLTAD